MQKFAHAPRNLSVWHDPNCCGIDGGTVSPVIEQLTLSVARLFFKEHVVVSTPGTGQWV